MKLLIDNNLSFKLVLTLSRHFPDSMHIRETLGVLAEDYAIWQFAKENRFVILTKDNDFDERSQLYGCPPKIVHLVCGNKTTVHILDLLIRHKEAIISFAEEDGENCILKIY